MVKKTRLAAIFLFDFHPTICSNASPLNLLEENIDLFHLLEKKIPENFHQNHWLCLIKSINIFFRPVHRIYLHNCLKKF